MPLDPAFCSVCALSVCTSVTLIADYYNVFKDNFLSISGKFNGLVKIICGQHTRLKTHNILLHKQIPYSWTAFS